MSTKDLITIQQFCTYYEVSESFIDSLYEFELIEIVKEDNVKCVSLTQINKIEKLMRLHYDLDINLEGVQAISNLLNQVETLQERVNYLKNRLNFYEKQIFSDNN